MTSALIRVNYEGEVFEAPVTPETTLAQIISHIGLEPDLFAGDAPTALVFVNKGDTAMTWLDRDMNYYNNWHVSRGYIPSLHIKYRSEVDHLW
jgi:hypothetical protein